MTDEYKMTIASVAVYDMPGYVKYVNQHPIIDAYHYYNEYFHFVGDIVYAHAGEIIKYYGNGVVAIFHNSNIGSAENAVQASIKISLEKKYIINASIHTGEVLIGKVGHKNNRTQDIMGNVVNIVFRQMSLNNQLNIGSPYLMITEETMKELKSKYEMKDLGEHLLKGIDKEIRSYQVLTK